MLEALEVDDRPLGQAALAGHPFQTRLAREALCVADAEIRNEGEGRRTVHEVS
jgi:hypothetical protein